jgi:hypothetical protein
MILCNKCKGFTEDSLKKNVFRTLELKCWVNRSLILFSKRTFAASFTLFTNPFLKDQEIEELATAEPTQVLPIMNKEMVREATTMFEMLVETLHQDQEE